MLDDSDLIVIAGQNVNFAKTLASYLHPWLYESGFPHVLPLEVAPAKVNLEGIPRGYMQDIQAILDEIRDELHDRDDRGKVADYIPELAKIDTRKFAIAVATVDGEVFGVGDQSEPFSIQSISKVFTHDQPHTPWREVQVRIPYVALVWDITMLCILLPATRDPVRTADDSLALAP